MNSINPVSLNQQGKLFMKQTLDVFFSVEIIRVITMHVGIE